MCKSGLFWLGALLHPRIIANRLCNYLFILLIFIVIYVLGGNLIAIASITAASLLILLLATIFPNENIEFTSVDGRKTRIMVFDTELGLPAFFACDKKNGKAIIRVITTDKDGKKNVCIKSQEINSYNLHLVHKGFFVASEVGGFWTAYGVNYPLGRGMGFPYPALADEKSFMYVYGENDKIVLNLFCENDIFSVYAGKTINSIRSNFWIDPSLATFTLYKTTRSTDSFETNQFITYLLLKNDDNYELLALVNFTSYYKLYSVKVPKFSVRYDNKYSDYIYDKERGYRLFKSN